MVSVMDRLYHVSPSCVVRINIVRLTKIELCGAEACVLALELSGVSHHLQPKGVSCKERTWKMGTDKWERTEVPARKSRVPSQNI